MNKKTWLFDVGMGLIILFISFVVVTQCAATFPSVILSPYQVASVDSLTFRLQWEESVPLRGTSPIDGYAWEFDWSMNVDSLFTTSSEKSGFVSIDGGRDIMINGPATCGDTIFFQARVRPTGGWDTFAGWGHSSVVEFYCADSPPPPPAFIDLDTIPEFPMDEWPVADINARVGDFVLNVMPISVDPTVIWSLKSEIGAVELNFTSEFETAQLCAFVIRGGVMYKALNDFVTINQSAGDPGAVSVVHSTGRYACSFITSVAIVQNTFVNAR